MFDDNLNLSAMLKFEEQGFKGKSAKVAKIAFCHHDFAWALS